MLCLLAIVVVADQKGSKKKKDDSDSDSDEDDNDKWNKYKQNNKKGYKNPEEEEKRHNEFKKNDDKFKRHNDRQKTGHVHYKMGHNKFSDRNDTDLERKYLHKLIRRDFTKVTPQKPASSYPPGPDSISYRTSTLPVLNQGECGCCWAFSGKSDIIYAYNLYFFIQSIKKLKIWSKLDFRLPN